MVHRWSGSWLGLIEHGLVAVQVILHGSLGHLVSFTWSMHGSMGLDYEGSLGSVRFWTGGASTRETYASFSANYV